jgi:hypothetical protein
LFEDVDPNRECDVCAGGAAAEGLGWVVEASTLYSGEKPMNQASV